MEKNFDFTQEEREQEQMEEKDINIYLRIQVALNFPAITMLLTDGKEDDLKHVLVEDEDNEIITDQSDSEYKFKRVGSAKKGQISQISLSSDSNQMN